MWAPRQKSRGRTVGVYHCQLEGGVTQSISRTAQLFLHSDSNWRTVNVSDNDDDDDESLSLSNGTLAYARSVR